MTRRTTVTCSHCSATADVPDDGDFSLLWDAGWRWIGSQDLFSCPDSPQVVVVTEDGLHRTGPGVIRAS